MTDTLLKTKYLVDTNVLINFSLWKPISLNLNNEFWSKFSETLKNGEWVLLDVVVNEILYDGDLMKWCKEQKRNGFVTKIGDEHKERGIKINDQYKMVDQTNGKSEVDTYVIAYAEANGLGIFSREAPKKPEDKLSKIPDVCRALGIGCIYKPKEFLKNIGFN